MSKVLTDDIISELKGKITSDTPTISSLLNYAGNNQLAFGLGGECIAKENTDLNSYPNKTGFYHGTNGNNRPTEIDVYNRYYVIQLRYDGAWGCQILIPFANGRFYMRIQINGTWTAWTKFAGTIL